MRRFVRLAAGGVITHDFVPRLAAVTIALGLGGLVRLRLLLLAVGTSHALAMGISLPPLNLEIAQRFDSVSVERTRAKQLI